MRPNLDRNARTASNRSGAALLGLLALTAAIVGCGGNSSDDNAGGSTVSGPATTSVAPLPLPGPYPIACSNVAQDFSGTAQSAAQAQAYWEGRPDSDGSARYANDLLTDPGNALSVTVNTPDDATLFGSFAGKPVEFVVLVCYPTSADNTRSDFALPTGKVVPRMQTGAQPPLFASASIRYPGLAFSHGLAGSPLSGDNFAVLSWLASFGNVLVTQQGVTRLRGTRQLVTLIGGDHELDASSSADVMTWSVTFLDALVRGTPSARAILTTMTSVEGGGDDRLVLPLSGPLVP